MLVPELGFCITPLILIIADWASIGTFDAVNSVSLPSKAGLKVEIKELADVATSSQADVLALNTFILLEDVSKYISPLALDPPPGLVLGADPKAP